MFEIDRLALGLLGHGVDIAKAPLEWITFEYGARAGRLIGESYGITRLHNGVGAGQPQPGAMVKRPVIGRAGLPRRGEPVDQIGTGRSEIGLGLDDLSLNRGIFPQYHGRMIGRIVHRQRYECIQRRTRDPQRHPGKGDAIECGQGHAVKRAVFPPVGG